MPGRMNRGGQRSRRAQKRPPRPLRSLRSMMGPESRSLAMAQSLWGDFGVMSKKPRPLRIVPLCPPGWPGAALPRTAAPAAMQLTYRGGPLLTAVEVVSVFWGRTWNDSAEKDLARQLSEFLQF